MIELLIGISVFIIVLTAITGIFISGIKIQKKFLAQQELLNEANRVADYISRVTRSAIEDEGGWATGPCVPFHTNYEIITAPSAGLKFLRKTTGSLPDCQIIFLENGRIKNSLETKSESQDYLPSVDYLTPSNLIVNSLKFQVYGDPTPPVEKDNIQPRIIFSLEMQNENGEKVKISSTISQRSLDVNL